MTRTWNAYVIFSIVLLACESPPPEKAPCDHLFQVPVDYQVNASGTLESIAFAQPLDCHGKPARVAIPRWWKEGACGVVISWREPTYAQDAAPAKKSSHFVYDKDAPNVVGPPDEHPSQKPIVVDQSLDRLPTRGDTGRVCDGELRAP